MGLKISIDDFGTGYSSLSHLKRFQIDAVKIDRSFVREVTTSPDDAAIAGAVVAMAHSLRLQVIARALRPWNSSSSCGRSTRTRSRATPQPARPADDFAHFLRSLEAARDSPSSRRLRSCLPPPWTRLPVALTLDFVRRCATIHLKLITLCAARGPATAAIAGSY